MHLVHAVDYQFPTYNPIAKPKPKSSKSEAKEPRPYGIATVLKRGLDIVIGLMGTATFLCLYPLIFLINKLESPGPVLYFQSRVGLDKRSRNNSEKFASQRKEDVGGQIFTICKFRTMRVDAENNGPQLCVKGRDPRVTKFGHLLRSTHLDELPQFWNVLKGEMSFIGPRPERPHFTVKYFEKVPQYRERTRLLKPGITGLAQITLGYDDTLESIVRKTRHDLVYRNSLFGFRTWLKMEMWIFWNTLRYLLNRAPLGEAATVSLITPLPNPHVSKMIHETQLFTVKKSITRTEESHLTNLLPSATPGFSKKPSVGNFLTIDVECWFHAHNLNVPRSEWDHSQTQIVNNVQRILNLLSKHNTKATFFILGYVADRFPDVVRMIDDAGHEIGTHGYYHDKVTDLTPDQFEEDLVKSLNTLAKYTPQKIYGHRASNFSIVKSTLWALEILERNGIEYDSSIFPIARKRYGIGNYPNLLPHQIALPLGKTITEIPMSTLKLAGKSLPVAGGGYLRLYPYQLTEMFIRRRNLQGTPAMVYFHPWELDAAQPKRKVGTLKAFQHYVNLDTTEQKLNRLLENFHFTSIYENLKTSSIQTMLHQNPVQTSIVPLPVSRGASQLYKHYLLSTVSG